MNDIIKHLQPLGINKKQRQFLQSLEWSKMVSQKSQVKLLSVVPTVEIQELSFDRSSLADISAENFLFGQTAGYVLITIPDNIHEELFFEVVAGSYVQIKIGKNCKLTLIEKRTKKKESKQPTLSGIDLLVGENSQIDYVVVQDREISQDVQLRFAHLSRDASIAWHLHFLVAPHNYVYTRTLLNGEQTAAELSGTYTTSGSEKLFMDYSMAHLSPHTPSNIVVHGIGSDSSSSDFIGRIQIETTATNTDAHLDEHCLLFSEKAQHDTMPVLEIHTNEVKATHSASITQLDAAYLFYLASRGIAPEEAKKLIIQSFLAEMYGRIPVDTERKRVEKMIEKLYYSENSKLKV